MWLTVACRRVALASWIDWPEKARTFPARMTWSSEKPHGVLHITGIPCQRSNSNFQWPKWGEIPRPTQHLATFRRGAAWKTRFGKRTLPSAAVKLVQPAYGAGAPSVRGGFPQLDPAARPLREAPWAALRQVPPQERGHLGARGQRRGSFLARARVAEMYVHTYRHPYRYKYIYI